MLAVKGRVAFTRPAQHQLHKRTQRRPTDLSALVHVPFVLLVQRHGCSFPLLGRSRVEQQPFELLPQVHAIGPGQDRFKHLAIPERVLEEPCKHAVIVQHCANQNAVHGVVWWPQRQNGLGHERLELVALRWRVHVLVILDIVHDREIRTVRAMATSPDLLGRTKGFHLAATGRDDHTRAPDLALAAGLGEVACDPRVGLQLSFDRLQHFRRLLKGIHHNDGVPLRARDNAPCHERHGDLGGLGLTTRRGNRVALARLGVDDLRQALVQVLVKYAGLCLAVVREVIAVPVLKAVDRIAHLATTFGDGLGRDVPAIHVGVDLLAQVVSQRGQVGQELLAGLRHHRTFANSAPKGSSVSTNTCKCCGNFAFTNSAYR